MQLVPKSMIKQFEDAGLWSSNPETGSLDGQLRHNALNFKEKIAYVDDPNKRAWSGEDPREVTWGQLNNDVEALASFFKGLGMPEDSIVGIYGANSIETIKTVLAVHRCGLIAAPLPCHWSKYDIGEYLENLQVRIIVTAGRLENDEMALRCRAIAQDLFSIRFVFGFGAGLPDGVVNLDRILDMTTGAASEKSDFLVPHPSTAVVIMPPATHNTGNVVGYAFSSNQAFSMAKAAYGACEEAKEAMCPFGISGLSGFLFSVIEGLRRGRKTHLHHFISQQNLVDHVTNAECDLLILPSRMQVPDVASLRQICLVHKNTYDSGSNTKSDNLEESFRIVDVISLNGVALIGQTRETEAVRFSLPATLTRGEPKDVCLWFKTQSFRKNLDNTSAPRGGEIVGYGAGLPTPFTKTLKASEHTFLQEGDVPTGVFGTLLQVATDEEIQPIGMSSHIVTINEITVEEEWLDQLYQSIRGVKDAAHFFLPDSRAIGVAIQPEEDMTVNETTLKLSLSTMGVHQLFMPRAIFEIPKIPRGTGNQAKRAELLSEYLNTQTDPVGYRRSA